MTAWSDPANLSTTALAKHLRLTDVGNDYYVLTYVRAQTHYAQLICVSRDSAVAIGSPLAFHTADTGVSLLLESAPETLPALYVGKGVGNTLVYSFVETDTTNAYTRFFLLNANATLAVLASDADTHTGSNVNAACVDLGDGALLTVLGTANNIRFTLAVATVSTLLVKRTNILTTWTSNRAIPLSLVRTGYRTGLLASSYATNPSGLTLANAEAFTIELTAAALAGSANPTVTQYSGTAAELRLLPGSYPVWNGTSAIGVMDATADPFGGTPFLAALDAQIFTEGPASETKALPTWVELDSGSPRLFANTTDQEVVAVARVIPDGTEVERWQLITDALVAPVQVDLPMSDERFAGLTTTSTTVDSIAVVKAGAYYLTALAYTNGAENKLMVSAYKDDAALYGYVQDNQLRVIQRPLPSPGVLYPMGSVQISEVAGLDTTAKTPSAPTNLIVSSTSYTDTMGLTRARVTFQWDPVTTNTDGSEISDFAYYTVFMRVDSSSASYQFVGNAFDEILEGEGFEPGTIYRAIVYAVNASNISSQPSVEVTFTTAGDTTPPAVPSTPILTSKLGTICATWDGLGSAGENMPADFAHVEVHFSTTNNFTPSTTTLLDKIIGQGYAIATNLVAATTYYFKFVAVDTSGNKSSASTQASTQPVLVQGADIEAASITANNIAVGAIDGQVITGATIQTAKPLAQGGQNARILLDSTKLIAYDSSANPTFTLTASTGAVSLKGDITAGSTITGATIEGGSLRIGSTSTASTFKADSTNGIYLGSQDPGSAPFKVTLAGALSATNATITGAITGSSTITIGSANSIFKVDSNGLYLGNATFASAPFRVAMDGSLTTASATITGGTITIGSGNSVFKADTSGIYLGNATFALAPFRVTAAGALTASNVTITGGSLSIGSRFSVDSSGNLNATNAVFSGSVTANNFFQVGGANGINYSGTGAVSIGTNVNIAGSLTASAVNVNSNNYWNSSEFRTGSASNYLSATSGGVYLTGSITGTGFTLTASPSGGSAIFSQELTTPTVTAATYTSSAGNALQVLSGGDLYLRDAGSPYRTYGSSQMYNYAVAGRALQIEGSGIYTIGTTASTRRIKQEIAPSSFDASLLYGLPLQQFRYKYEVERDENAPIHHGLMAEDVAEIGLEWLIDRDDEGLPSYIYWSERMPQAMLKLLQEQNQEIQALKARVSALES